MSDDPSNEKVAHAAALFEGRRNRQKAFTRDVESIVRRILVNANIAIINIESRTKSVESFKEKCTREDKNYTNPIDEITDLSGIRVVCYYTKHVDTVADIIRKEFEVDENLTVDRRRFEDTDKFGYQSMHLIASLHKDRVKLPEYREFKGLRAEIQVRTSLQHAWAAIEHKLQYKNARQVPINLRRKLFRIAALLELADEEFNYLDKNIQNERKEIRENIKAGDLSQGINLDSVEIYTISSGVIHEVVDYFKASKIHVAPPPPNAANPIGKLIDSLNVSEVKDVAHLDKVLNGVSPRIKWKKYVQEFEEEWCSKVAVRPVIDRFTIVRVMYCLSSREAVYKRIMKAVPFGGSLHAAVQATREKITNL